MIYLIGDVQGCDEALGLLLDEIGFSVSRDRLVLLGDLVNRGPSSLATLRRLSGLGADASMAEVLASAPVQAHFQNMADDLAMASTGSANRIARFMLMDQPACIDKGEVTDKGSINQRAVLQHRAAQVEALHDDNTPHITKPRIH